MMIRSAYTIKRLTLLPSCVRANERAFPSATALLDFPYLQSSPSPKNIIIFTIGFLLNALSWKVETWIGTSVWCLKEFPQELKWYHPNSPPQKKRAHWGPQFIDFYIEQWLIYSLPRFGNSRRTLLYNHRCHLLKETTCDAIHFPLSRRLTQIYGFCCVNVTKKTASLLGFLPKSSTNTDS